MTAGYCTHDLSALAASLRQAGRRASELAAAIATASDGEPVIITGPDGNARVAMIPAADLHEKDHCCCNHCPWGGDHSEKVQADRPGQAQ